MAKSSSPPRDFRRFLGLPYTWWRHIKHLHVAVYLNEVGRIKCAICWQDYRSAWKP